MKHQISVRGLTPLIIILLSLLYGGSVFAGPASPDPVKITQPKYGPFKAFIRGDEFQGWVETDSGYTVVQNDRTGYWEYAVKDNKGRLRPSGTVVNPLMKPPTGITKNLMPDKDTRREQGLQLQIQSVPFSHSGGYAASAWNPQQISGTRKLLVILVEFSNRSLNTTAGSWYTRVFNTEPGAKSVVNYYQDNSFGAVSVTPVEHTQPGSPPGVVRVTVPTAHPNYANYYSFGAEAAWVGPALAEAANYVDFGSLDTNQDGAFQNTELLVCFICAGYEASGTMNAPRIWAHCMSGPGIYAGGVSLSSWGVTGELNDFSLQQPMGAMTHELGHLMCGLPDLYDSLYRNMGLGAFSVMSYGSWGRTSLETSSGSTPVALDAWSREYLGWSAPRTLQGGLGVQFVPSLSSPDAAVKLIKSPLSDTQYFLAENRYPAGWDRGLELFLGQGWGGGLLIMHIDITVGTPGANNINTYTSTGHQGVMAEEASTAGGSMLAGTSKGNALHLFCSGNNDSFTDSTTPGSRLYNGASTMLGLTNISARSQTMTADIVALPPYSSITGPENGVILHGESVMITGSATDYSGAGIDYVEASTDGGVQWSRAAGGSSWSYPWYLPKSGSFTLMSRARDKTGAVETPGPGNVVTVDNGSLSALQHLQWDVSVAEKKCGNCHQKENGFVTEGYLDDGRLCRSCHNAAGSGHRPAPNGGDHPIFVDVSTPWTKRPTYGDITAPLNDNRLYAHLVNGRIMTCTTCHNPMNKYEDYGREWELTISGDNMTYALQRGGWSYMGFLAIKVYRDMSLWAGPADIRDREHYLVEPSEYTYNEYTGTVTFKTSQQSGTYVYVTLDYPYLRVSNRLNRLCLDCHKTAAHKGANCLVCHDTHHSVNIKRIRNTVRTTDLSERDVVFMGRTGAGSFADGGQLKDGICEVCHTKTKYYRRDGTGFINHSGGKNYDGKRCTSCHRHRTGFSIYS